MNIFNKNTTRTISRQPQDSLPHRIASDPYLDWLIMIVVAAVSAGILIGIGYMSYTDVESRLSSAATVGVTSQRSLFDDQVLARVLKNFDLRAEEQAMLVKGYAGVADPSL